jgi:fibro-slime domain-containing protein
MLGLGGSDGGPSLEPVDMGEGGGDGCDSILNVTYRDFTEQHPDFECCNGGYGVYRGMVDAALGMGRKPAFKSGIGDCILQQVDNCDPSWKERPPVIKDAASFGTWYVTTDGVNAQIDKTLELLETAAGSGVFVYESSAFFPIGIDEGLGPSPAGRDKNFLFTTEIHLRFEYKLGQKFTFNGDDDLWIFVNDKLALDLGGLHSKFEDTLDFDAKAAELGIRPGGKYNMDVFHAERHTEASNFRIETNIACFERVVVK